MPRLRNLLGLLGMAISLGVCVAGDVHYVSDQPLPLPTARGHYMVVISAGTAADPSWLAVAELLRAKYDGGMLVTPDGEPERAYAILRQRQANYVCFLMRPEEAGRDTVVRLHRLMRRLDLDPYTDATWAILTGYEAADAMRIAKRSEPLAIRSGYSSMGPGLMTHLGGGFATSETDAKAFWLADETGKPQYQPQAADPTAALARAFAASGPQLMHTSGHASSQTWSIGYSVDAGSIVQRDGQLSSVDLDGRRHDFRSPEPKVYMALGNCDIGHIARRDCLATAWIHSGGVHQMYGYTGVTFHGYLGWGVNAYFADGAMSLSQAFFGADHALIHRLRSRFPAQAAIEITDYSQPNGAAHGLGGEAFGLLWDRDIVGFYGDPAWVARMPQSDRAWEASLTHGELADGEATYTLTFGMLREHTWPDYPLILPLPQRLLDIHGLVQPEGMAAVVADDFILLPLQGRTPAGTTYTLRFNAVPYEPPTTSATQPIDRVALRRPFPAPTPVSP